MEIRWSSFHLFFDRELDLFLAQALSPGLTELYRMDLLKRAFFIRYSEGGFHLRLRLWPKTRDDLSGWVKETAERFNQQTPGAISRVEQVPYDRRRDYFGETWDTVYAELLNMATSQITLSLLGSKPAWKRSQLLLVTSAALSWLLEQAGLPHDQQQFLTTRSRFFAERVLLDTEPERMEQAITIPPTVRAAHHSSKASLYPSFDTSAAFRRAAGVSRRMLAQQGVNSVVFNHGLHLLCNKLGLGLADERFMFTMLEEVS